MTRYSRPYAVAQIPDRSTTFREGVDGLEKRCSCCHEWWPADTEFFTRHEARPGGLATVCKACGTSRPRPPAQALPLAGVPWLGSQLLQSAA